MGQEDWGKDSKPEEVKPKVVRNRDIALLSEVQAITQEIAWLEERRQWQRERMFNMGQNLSGMPHQSGGLPRGIDDKLAAVDAYQEQIEEDMRKVRLAERVLQNIKSPSMRVFVLMRYVMKLPDARIREELAMTRRGIHLACRWVEEAPSMAEVIWQEAYVTKEEGEQDV